MTVFDCKNLTFSYRDGAATEPLLDGLSLTIPVGCTFGIIGPNGSGKSTLLRCLYRSLEPQSGEVFFYGEGIKTRTTRQLAHDLAVVVQNEQASIPLTVREYIRLGRAVYHRAFEGYSAADNEIVDEVIGRLGLTPLQNRSIMEISGGEHQRVMLARALAQRTAAILLDEPTNHLDAYYQHEVLRIVKDEQISATVVLHDLNHAARYCDLIALLDQGRIVTCGTPEEVLQPEIIESVYRLKMHSLEIDSTRYLLLLPHG